MGYANDIGLAARSATFSLAPPAAALKAVVSVYTVGVYESLLVTRLKSHAMRLFCSSAPYKYSVYVCIYVNGLPRCFKSRLNRVVWKFPEIYSSFRKFLDICCLPMSLGCFQFQHCKVML